MFHVKHFKGWFHTIPFIIGKEQENDTFTEMGINKS